MQVITKIILASIFSIIATVSFSQTQPQKLTPQQKKQQRRERINQLLKQEEEGVLVYSRQNAFGIKLNTDGYGIFFEHGKYQSVTKTNLWWLELGEHHSKKEDKQSIPTNNGYFIYSGSPFIFGKINNFYNFNIGIGQQLLIGQKGNKNGVAVSFIYGGGLSAGLLKPYYLTIQDSTGNNVDIKYSAATDTSYRDPALIVGSPGFTKGLNQIQFVPGIHARVALRFDYGRYNELLSAIEVGLNAAYYTQNMQIMLDNPGKKFIFNAYVALAFGKRK